MFLNVLKTGLTSKFGLKLGDVALKKAANTGQMSAQMSAQIRKLAPAIDQARKQFHTSAVHLAKKELPPEIEFKKPEAFGSISKLSCKLT